MQNSKQVGVAIRFVARFGRSKVRALRLVSSGVKEREANRSDVQKERLDTRRDRSGAVRGSKRTQPISPRTLYSTLCYMGIRMRPKYGYVSVTHRAYTKTLDFADFYIHLYFTKKIPTAYFKLFKMMPHVLSVALAYPSTSRQY